jgi:Zn-dependent protease
MTFPVEIMQIVRDLILGVFDFVTGNRRRRYETSIFVRAPREIVWAIVRSKDLMLGGVVPMRIITETVPGSPGHEKSRVIIGQREMIMFTRCIDERPGEALLLELIAEGTDPAVVLGAGDRIGYALFDGDGGTSLYLSRELTRTKWQAVITAPMGLRSGARRFKAKAEQVAGVPADQIDAAITAKPMDAPGSSSNFGLSPNGLLLAAAAFASFSYLWGWQQALIITAIIVMHELGHALAMIIAGIPVKGVYLVPFFGGAAVAGAPYRSEGQIGFVALMGPGFSLIPTLALAYAANETDSDQLFKAAEISAFINLFNLVPIIPLDGGLVLKSALVSVSRSVAQAAGIAGAMAGLYVAWLLRDPLLGVFVALGLLVTRQIKSNPVHDTMRWPSAVLLLLAFLVTITAYLAIIRYTSDGRLLP